MSEAERLFRLLTDGRTTLAQVREGIEEYGSAERRATVERIRTAFHAVTGRVVHGDTEGHAYIGRNDVDAILDAEAERG